MKLRFFHTEDLDADRSTMREVFPLGPKQYTWKAEKKEVFFRQNQKGGYLFENQQNIKNSIGETVDADDFDFFIAKELNAFERCKTRYIIAERFCTGSVEDDANWEEFHVGKFTLNDCQFDLDKCTINAKQSIVDVYSCLKENKKEKYNILTSAPEITTFSPRQNNYEYSACRNKEWLATSNRPCDATGGWKKFYAKTAINTPQPASTTFNEATGDDYKNCAITKNHAFWIKEDAGVYTVEIYRFADSTLLAPIVVDSLSTLVVDKGMVGFTTDANKTFKTFRPDDATATTIVLNNALVIEWFDVDDDLGFAFYYDGTTIRAYDFNTAIIRTVDIVTVSSGAGVKNIDYGEGVLVYHDAVTLVLNRYNPQTFLINEVQTALTSVKFLFSEASFITWFDADVEFMYLQNRDDTTFENILLRDNGGDCRFATREEEWIVFDDEFPASAQIAVNLITLDVTSPASLVGGAPVVNFYGISNGWFLMSAVSVPDVCVYLDSNPGAYGFVPPATHNGTEPVFMAAGVERIYISGPIGGGDRKIWSIDQDSQIATEIENLGPVPLNCLLMNNFEQIISTNADRVEVSKENIQRDDELQVWFREIQKSICVGSTPVPPTGAGWTILRNQCNQFGTATWVRPPTLATPPPSEISEGGCACSDEIPDLVVDKDNCVSINPDALITDLLMNPTTTLLAGTIIGPIDAKQPLGGSPFEVTWYIEKPRDGSTYTWALPVMPGATIISGQGTDVLVVEFTFAFPITAVECQETNPCEIGPIPLMTIPFIVYAWNLAVSTATVSVPVLAETDTYSGATIRFIRAFENPWITGGSSNVSGSTGPANSFIDSKNRRVLEVTHDGISGSVSWTGSNGGATFSKSVSILVAPTPSLIDTPAEVCPTGIQTFRVLNPRLGCTYKWSVDAPAFIVGFIIGTTVQVDMNGATGVEQIHLEEVCPVVPLNYQLVAPCDELHDDSWWWVLGNDIQYKRNRLLKTVVEDLVEFICPELDGIRSEFFQWNPLNPTSINYVTLAANELMFLTLAQKSDIRNPNASEPATIGNLTFQELVDWFRVMFEVYWFIEDNILHFEHISIIQGPLGIDTTQGKFVEFAENQNQYTYDKTDMKRREVFNFAEAENVDFVGFPIEYKDSSDEWSLCVNDEDEDLEAEDLTTDLKFIQTNPGDISNQGFVMLANEFDGTDYRVISSVGIISGFNVLNSPLGWSNLQENYMQYNRTLAFGWVNRSFRLFLSSKFFKKQKKFKIPLCCDDTFEPLDLIRTTLGDGKVEQAEIDFKDDMLELKLKYE